MRKAITLSLDEKIIIVLKTRADKKHLSISRLTEETLRKALRL